MTVAGTIDDKRTIERFVEMVLGSPVNQPSRDHDGPRYFLGIRLADGTSVVGAFWLETGELSRGIMTDPVVTLSVWWELPNEHLLVGTDGGPRNRAGNPNSPQTVIFLTSITDVMMGS